MMGICVASNEAECDCSVQPKWKLWTRCTRHCWNRACPDWMDMPPLTHSQRVERSLRGKLFGQETAVQRITAAFRSKKPNRPLSFHFVGENGVGKTRAARLIGESLFQIYEPSLGHHRGELYLRGSTYKTSNATRAEEYRLQLRETIISRLQACSNSLIIVDELELVHKQTVTTLQEFLDVDNFPFVEMGDRRASTANAIFIFISDFGAEGITQEDTLEGVMTRIRFETERIWGDIKQAGLIEHIVPFVPLTFSKDGAHNMIEYLLSELPRLDQFRRWNLPVDQNATVLFAPSSKQLLIDKIISTARTELYRNDNYRAIEKIFSQIVTQSVVLAAEEWYSAQPMGESTKQLQKVKLGLQLMYDSSMESVHASWLPSSRSSQRQHDEL